MRRLLKWIADTWTHWQRERLRKRVMRAYFRHKRAFEVAAAAPFKGAHWYRVGQLEARLEDAEDALIAFDARHGISVSLKYRT